MAEGDPHDLLPDSGPVRTLTSDTTRRAGVVSNEDVAPTILRYFGLFVPPEMHGSPIRFSDEPAPYRLHARHLANRRMSVPVQAAAGVYVTVAGLFLIALLAARSRVPRWLGRSAAWLGLTVAPASAALLAAGHLSKLSYGTVVPFVVGVTLIGTFAFAPLKHRGILVPPAAIGLAVLAYFAVEARLSWTAALTPFLGGSELDGARFYGLPNVFIGLLMGSGLYVAARFRPLVGFVGLVAVALFAGLPGAGANLGGALSILAAAGLWLALRRSGRLGWSEAALAAAVVVIGMAVVLLAHAFLTTAPTHGTRFVQGPGRSLSGLWRTATDRLLVGWHLIVRDPFALVPVLGVPVCLYVVRRPPAPVREALDRHPEWRDCIFVLLLASVVAYFANDSGAAALGLGFGLALGGLLYVSLSEQDWKVKET